MYRLIFITGASGAGKTTAAKILESQSTDFAFFYFDAIGVPSAGEMNKQYGSGEEWQRHKTVEWVKRITAECLDRSPAVLDGQVRQSFIDEACRSAALTDYRIILFDCEDSVRRQRLLRRGQLDLANDRMSNWARYLREQALLRNETIIDTTKLTCEEAAAQLQRLMSL
jgi:dephospho-CoA kinase